MIVATELGTLVTLGLYAAFLVRSIRRVRHAPHPLNLTVLTLTLLVLGLLLHTRPIALFW